MTDIAARRIGLRPRTGGPTDDDQLKEHIVGWTLVIVIAMLTAQLGLF
ncbi:SCO1431 family membrane protein [Streptomyces sp. NA02950]|nr:SCO1431 family membrane protein [Streptomyces sp. NA02950]QKV94472.1 SCO1431 family membrane protein [Streptomyces sp. NA02950]